MTRRTFTPCWLLCALLAAASAAAQPTTDASVLALDLETALRMAAVQNLSLRGSALDPEIARQRIREEGGRFDPRLELSYQHGVDSNSQPLDPFGERPPSSEIRSTSYETGIAGQLPTGGRYTAGLSTRNRRGTFNSFADEYSSFLGVTLTQPLLHSFGTRSALAPLRIARVQGESARWLHRQFIDDTLTGTAFAYYSLVLARGSLEVSERSLRLVDQLAADNEKREQRGIMSTQDVIEAQARAARRRETIYARRRAVIEAENDLKRYIYADFSQAAALRIEPRWAATDVPGIEEFHAYADAALASRPDYQRARLTVDQRRIELGLRRNELLPQVDLVGSFGYVGAGENFRDSTDAIEDRRRDSDSYSVGAIVTVPLPNRSALARRRAAELELRRAELALENFTQEVQRQLADSFATIEAARQRVTTAREARDLAERSLQGEEKRLQTGTGSTFQVLDKQETLAQAQFSELSAAADLAMSVADFHRLCGRTVEAYGLDPDLFVRSPER